MKLRRETLERFAEDDRQKFVDRLVAFLREQFPESRQIPDYEFHPEVERQVKKAALYGLFTEQETTSYVVTAWLTGPDFDSKYPEATKILKADRPAAARASDLERWTVRLFEALNS